jgi:hypothetical protein
MYGLTRGMMTVLGAGVAGLLIWIATQVNDHRTGGYWAVYGLIAGAGLTMALSQLFGGWTKWGWPRVSGSVFLLGFLPVLVAAGWIILAHQPHPNWFRTHVLRWSGDIHIRGLVRDLEEYVSALAFGIGLVFGFTFDTSGPRAVVAATESGAVAAPAGPGPGRTAATAAPVEPSEARTRVTPRPEPAPRAGEPPAEE